MMSARNYSRWYVHFRALVCTAAGLFGLGVGLGRLPALTRALYPRIHSPLVSPLRAGALAPDFSLTDRTGKEYRLSALRGKKVLLNFFCGCGRCFGMAPEWQKMHHQSGGILVLGITAMGHDEAALWCEAAELTMPVVFDPGHRVARLYSSTHCPRSWLIDEVGRIIYSNQTDDAPYVVAAALRHRILGTADHGPIDGRNPTMRSPAEARTP